VAVKTFYLLNTTAVTPDWMGRLQDGGTAPTAALSAFGWKVAKTSTSTPFWTAHIGATGTASAAAGASSFGTASAPVQGTGNTATLSGDSFRSPTNYAGVFASGNWTFTFGMRCSTSSSQAGQINFRVWASTDPNGQTGVRSLTTGGAQVASAVTLSSTTATFNSTFTWSAPQITLLNEYLFISIQWQSTVAGGSNNADVLFYQSGGTIATADFQPIILGTLSTTEAADTAAISGSLLFTTANMLASWTPSVSLNNSGTGYYGAAFTPSTNQTINTVGIYTGGGFSGAAATSATIWIADFATGTPNAEASSVDLTVAPQPNGFVYVNLGAPMNLIAGRQYALVLSIHLVNGWVGLNPGATYNTGFTGNGAVFSSTSATGPYTVSNSSPNYQFVGVDLLYQAPVINATGTLSVTDGTDTSNIQGFLPASGSLSTTELADISAFSGILVLPAITGTLSTTDTTDTALFRPTVAFAQGIDFRATVNSAGAVPPSFVGDPVDCDWDNAGSSANNYPRLTAQGNTVGWDNAVGHIDGSRDRDNTIDPRLAGMVYLQNHTTPAIFYMDLPAPGDYTINLAIGDAVYQQVYQNFTVYDNTTPLFSANNIGGTIFADAHGNYLTAAQWPTNNVGVSRTFTSTKFALLIGGDASGTTTIAHLHVQSAASPVPVTTKMLSSFTAGTTRTDTAWDGACFTPNSNMTVYALGAYVVPTNVNPVSTTIALVDQATGLVITDVNINHCWTEPNGFTYGEINPTNLTAGHSYIVSMNTAPNAYISDITNTLTYSSDFTPNGAAYCATESGTYTISAPGSSYQYVGVDLKYIVVSAPAGTLSATDPTDTSAFSGSVPLVAITGTLVATDPTDTAGLYGGYPLWINGVPATAAISGSTLTSSLTPTCTPGDTVFVAANIEKQGTSYSALSSVTGGGVTWNFIGKAQLHTGGSTYNNTELWYAHAPSGLSGAVTITIGSAYDAGAWTAFSVSGADPTNQLDSNLSLPQIFLGSTSAQVVQTYSTTQSRDMIISVTAQSINANSPGVPTGFTNIVNLFSAGAVTNTRLTVDYQVTSSPQTNVTATYPVSTQLSTGVLHAVTADVLTPPVTGTISTTDPTDQSAFSGLVGLLGTLSTTEIADIATFAGQIIATGTLSATDLTDTSAFSGLVGLLGTLSATDPTDTAAFSAQIIATGTLAANDNPDTAAFTGSVVITGTLAANDNIDTANFVGQVISSGTLTATDPPDTCDIEGVVLSGLGGVLIAVDPTDSAVFSGTVAGIAGTLAANDNPDTAAFTGLVQAFYTTRAIIMAA